ncbi:MAG: hypothetical protein ACI4UU_04005 [Clostridia bacterium]
MKVLFAVNNESISESIMKKYQQQYKEIISAKNVYYFNAIIKELQKDKTYDRIVVSEDLQPFSNNNYDSIDRFIFEKMDNISDEATDEDGNDIPIILICADRRAKSDSLLVKLFGIGVYNALIEKDRSITEVCELLNHPRTKKEAKIYYRIDSDDVDYKSESEESVSEEDIQNILNYYKKLGKNEDRYVETFDHISTQYSDAQLKLIAKFLPLNVKAVLEANCPKYQEIVSFAPVKKRVTPEESPYNNYAKNKKVNKPVQKEDNIKLDIIEKNLNKSRMTEPVIIPSTINTKQVKKIEPEQIQSIDDFFEDDKNAESAIENSYKQEQPIQNIESEQKEAVEEQTRRRGRPRKNLGEPVMQQEPTVKRGRGRPKKQSAEDVQQVQQTQSEENDELVNLFGLVDEEETTNKTNLVEDNDVVAPKKVESNMILPGLDDDFFEQETTLEEKVHPTVKPDDNYSKKVNAYNNYNNYNENKYTEPTTQENIFAAQQREEPKQVESKNRYYYSTGTDLTSSLTKDKKIVAFIGTSKNGTSFLVNNVAEILSTQGINTAILDLTKNKNSYYIYTENEESLRKIATSSFENLKMGEAKGIQVHKNLTVYTSLPGEISNADDYQNILETLVKNHSLVLLDCDFNTNYGYFKEAQELYLVQSYDVLTIQPLTAFLRELKAKNLLDPIKIRVVINKALRMRSVSEKTIIGGMAFYNDPSMSYMTELFDKDSVQYCVIPFDEQSYSNYLEGLINCKITLNGYTREFMNALNKLGNMVYPLINSTTYTSNNYGNYSSNNFSNKINSTLNKMKNNH